MARLVRASILSLFALACTTQPNTTTTPACNATTVLEQDGGSTALTTAAQAHAPTDRELKVSALLWGQAVLAAEGEALDPLLTEAPVSELLSGIANQYPSLFAQGSPCQTWAIHAGALISTRDDFSCSNACVPDPALLAKTGKTLLDQVTTKLVARLKAMGKLTAYTQLVRDKMALVLKSQRALQQQYKTANKVYTRGQQVLDLLKIVDASMSLEESQQLLLDVTSVVGDVASLAGAPQVATVVLAFQLGFEIGTAANLVIDCERWKDSHCGADTSGGDASSGDSIGGDTSVGDTSGDVVLEGPFAAKTTGSNGDCTWTFSMTATLTLNDFGGGGTPGNPFKGNAEFSGILTSTLVSGEGCKAGTESLGFDAFQGSVSGSAGKVVIAGTVSIVGLQVPVDFPAGVWNGATVTGPLTVQLFPGTEITAAPMSATVVLAAP